MMKNTITLSTSPRGTVSLVPTLCQGTSAILMSLSSVLSSYNPLSWAEKPQPTAREVNSLAHRELARGQRRGQEEAPACSPPPVALSAINSAVPSADTSSGLDLA